MQSHGAVPYVDMGPVDKLFKSVPKTLETDLDVFRYAVDAAVVQAGRLAVSRNADPEAEDAMARQMYLLVVQKMDKEALRHLTTEAKRTDLAKSDLDDALSKLWDQLQCHYDPDLMSLVSGIRDIGQATTFADVVAKIDAVYVVAQSKSPWSC